MVKKFQELSLIVLDSVNCQLEDKCTESGVTLTSEGLFEIRNATAEK